MDCYRAKRAAVLETRSQPTVDSWAVQSVTNVPALSWENTYTRGDPGETYLTNARARLPWVTHCRPMADLSATHGRPTGDPWANTPNPWVTHGRPVGQYCVTHWQHFKFIDDP